MWYLESVIPTLHGDVSSGGQSNSSRSRQNPRKVSALYDAEGADVTAKDCMSWQCGKNG